MDAQVIFPRRGELGPLPAANAGPIGDLQPGLPLGEALTDAIEHARTPREPVVEVVARVGDAIFRIDVRDTGRRPRIEPSSAGTLVSPASRD